MTGARKYANLFKTGQYGKLYLVSGTHARGRTFRIYALPENEDARPNGTHNPPLNKSAVEVYGVIGGKPGWTESYGWLHEGKWQDDFFLLVKEKESDNLALQIAENLELAKTIAQGADRITDLLSKY